jgi:hypothetical protein
LKRSRAGDSAAARGTRRAGFGWVGGLVGGFIFCPKYCNLKLRRACQCHGEPQTSSCKFNLKAGRAAAARPAVHRAERAATVALRLVWALLIHSS